MLAAVEADGAAVEHRVLDDGDGEAGVLVGPAHALRERGVGGERSSNSFGMPAVRPVAKRLGAIVLTRMPSDPRSRAIVSDMPAIPALAAVYATWPI